MGKGKGRAVSGGGLSVGAWMEKAALPHRPYGRGDPSAGGEGVDAPGGAKRKAGRSRGGWLLRL